MYIVHVASIQNGLRIVGYKLYASSSAVTIYALASVSLKPRVKTNHAHAAHKVLRVVYVCYTCTCSYT